jgi:ABC-type polysaccharide transport system permease subunit
MHFLYKLIHNKDAWYELRNNTLLVLVLVFVLILVLQVVLVLILKQIYKNTANILLHY